MIIDDEVLVAMSKGKWTPPIRKLTGYDCICTVQDSPYRQSCPVHDPEHPAHRLYQHHERETTVLLDAIKSLASKLMTQWAEEK